MYLVKFDLLFIFINIKDMITVFTDGACSNNGRPTAKAGLGVYFGKNDDRNVAKPIIGKQSNNTAELSAVIEVFTILVKEIELNEEIIIYSDSIYTIRWAGEYGTKCEKKGWVTSSGEELPNLELGKTLYLLCKKYKNVKLEHIKAHTGLTDELSLGNEGADMMANLAIGREKGTESKTKYYLKIPYSEKIVGKKFGAKWDPKMKKWYYDGYETDSNFKTLMNLFPC